MRIGEVRLVLGEVGGLLLIVSLVALAMLPVALTTGEPEGIVAALVTAALCAAAGAALRRLRTPEPLFFRHAMMTAAVGWLLVPLFSVPPLLMLEGMPFLDAYFEMMSGWTGTGLTLLVPQEAHATTLWWRTLSQWVGGVGVIVLTLTVLARPGTAAFALYKGEGREEKLRPNVIGTVRTIWGIYLLYSVLAVALLWAVGLSFWNALNHGLTGLATGGFSVWNTSIAAFDSPAVELALIPIMIAGAVAFVVHYALLQGRVRAFLRDVQFRWLIGLVVAGSALSALALVHAVGFEEALRFGPFQWVSALTCTGFQSVADLSAWPAGSKLLLAVGMVIGGSAGSTAGGIKIVRTALLAHGVAWKVRRANHPAFAVVPFRFGTRQVRRDEANQEFAEAAFVTFLWILALLALIAAFLSIGASLDDALFEAATTVSNVGLSAGITTPLLPAWVKGVMVAAMWAGRLEIFPVLVLLRAALRRAR